MPDPLKQIKVTKENYREQLHFYKGIPELAGNIEQEWIEISVADLHDEVPFNSPQGSWVQVVYPFSKYERLADKYRKFNKTHMTIGQALEEIDVL